MRFIFFIFTFCLFTKTLTAVNENGDFQTWWQAQTVNQICDKSSFITFTEFRLGDDSSKFFYFETRLEYLYKALPFLLIGPAYRQIMIRNSAQTTNTFNPIYIPLLELTFFKDIGPVELSSRNWILYKMFPKATSNNLWEYRNRFQAIFQIDKSPFGLKPIVSDEVFFEETNGFRENRLFAGLIKSFNQKIDGMVGYLLKTQKFPENDWRNIQVLSINLAIGF